jgi:formylglycine-generating enzyme required for sulfatase activity
MQTAIDKIRELRTQYEDGLLGREEFDRRKEAILDTAWHDERARETVPARQPTELGLMPGQELGPPARRFRLERLVASGGMAEVWQATDLATEAAIGHSAQVALKILPPQRAAATHEARLLVEEALRARTLVFESIVRVYDWAVDPATGSTFVIMEDLDGEDLASVIARHGKMPLERACAVLVPVGEALDYAWDRHRLVHRDLKPANVVLLADGSVKLLDFGIAASLRDPAGSAAPANSGTAAYRAPEASDRNLVPDRGQDVYAAAVMLYQMVEGRLPHGAKPQPAGVPVAAWETMQAGFAPDAALRPASVTELLRRLRAAALQPAAPRAPRAVVEEAALVNAWSEEPLAPAAPVVAANEEAASPIAPPAAARAAAAGRQVPEPARSTGAMEEAERQARKEALRQRLREHIEQEARRAGQDAGAKGKLSSLTGAAAAAPLVPVGEQMVSSRLAYAATGTAAALSPASSARPAATAAPRQPEREALPGTARAPLGRLRDRFVDDSGNGPELVVLAGGRFFMGSLADEQQAALDAGARKAWVEREGPRHEVAIARAFAVARHQVTVGQWREFALATRWKGGSDVNWAAPGFTQTDEHPVVGVTWQDAQLYVRWLSARTGKPYRLPTEAEWEYACRAGTTTPFSFGENIRPEQANYDARFAWTGNVLGVPRRGTAPVGSYPANAWGLCDMHGNVWEWVQDAMHDSYQGAPTDGSAWEEGGDPARRVLRGGSWLYHPRYLRSAVRNGFAARLSNDKVGFRVVRNLE